MTDIKIPAHWTSEQATAVFEFVDDLRVQILTHYRIQITEYMKENRCYDPGYYEDFEEIKDEDIPF